MTKAERKEIAEIPITDLLLGLIVFLHGQPFAEQQIYRLFKELSDENSDLADRVRVHGPPKALHSESIRQTLSFLEMGKILEIPQPNPVVQFYRARKSQIPNVKKNLEQDKILPKHKTLFETLAKRLRTIAV